MAVAGTRVELTATQSEALAPRSTGSLAFVWLYNPNSSAVYLNVWSSTPNQGDRTAAQRVGGPWPVGAGQSVPVLVECRHAGAVRLSASTGTDGTGAPSTACQAVPHWES